MYLSQAQLNELCDFQTDHAAISLYVYSSPQENRDHFHQRLNRLAETVQDKTKQFEGPISRWMSKGLHLDRLHDALLEVFVEEKGQTCCVFIADDFFVVVDLPLRFSEFITVDYQFFVKPLMGLIAQFERFAVLICDGNRARLFGIHLNEIEEQTEIFADNDLPEVNKIMPAWECLRSGVTNQRLHDPLQRHLKNTTDRLKDCFTALGFNQLILGIPQDLHPLLRHHLSTELEDRLIATIDSDTTNNTSVIYHQIKSILREHRHRRESRILILLREAREQNQAILGVPSVTQALMAGQVRQLILKPISQNEGWLCPQGHLLGGSFSADDICPQCQQNLEPVQDLDELLLVEALSQNTDVFHILHNNDQWEDQNIGAFLRIPNPSKPKSHHGSVFPTER